MISGKILRDAIISGANNINNQRSRVDELNVFPVPDGDTGTNMGMTVGASVRELEALDDSCTVGEASKTAASAMLRGARGNSGVITSLLFRGFSKALEGKKEADVADIVGVSRQNMRKLMLGHADSFPLAIHEGSTSLWHLAEVLSWLDSKGGYPLKHPVIEVARVAQQVNTAKESKRIGPLSGELVALLG